MKIYVTTPGIKAVLAELSKYPASVGRKHFRMALNAAAGTTKKAAEVYMPRETGTAKRSLRVKVVVPAFSYNVAHHDRPARATVGVGRGIVRRVPRIGKGKSSRIRVSTSARFRGRVQGPSAYLHLIEKGSKAHAVSVVNARLLSNGKSVFGKRVNIRARGTHPMANAWRQTNSIAEGRMIAKLQQGIAAEAALAYQKSLRVK